MEIRWLLDENLKKVNLKCLTWTADDYYFVLEAETLECLVGIFALLKQFANCNQVSCLSSLHYGFLQGVQQ